MNQSLDLYSTAAQIIPLFLGFLVFELQRFALGQSGRGSRPGTRAATGITALLVISLLVFGEVAAIDVLAGGTEGASARTAVLTALFAGGLLLSLGIAEMILKPLVGRHVRKLEVGANVIVVLAVAGWLLWA